MNVLRVIPSMDPSMGGPCQGIRNSIPELAKYGIINEVVCFDDADNPYLGKDDFVINPLGAASGPWSYNQALPSWLMTNLHRFDAVIIHGLWLYHSYSTVKTVIKFRKLFPLKKLSLFVMPHGMLDPYFQQASGRRLKAARNWLYWKLIERKVVNLSNGVLFTTEEEKQLAKGTFKPYQPANEINVGYGVKTPPPFEKRMEQAFRELSVTQQSPYWLFLSRLHSKKGVDLLISAYLQLKKEQPALPALVIAGPIDDSAYVKEIQTLAGKDNNIYFPGMLTGDAKWGAFYGAEVFVLPSHQENFGIAVAESLSCGLPVLITDKINIWREISAGNAGLIEKDTLEGTIAVLRKWLRLDDAGRRNMAVNARRTFEEHFSITESAKRMAEVLKTGRPN